MQSEINTKKPPLLLKRGGMSIEKKALIATIVVLVVVVVALLGWWWASMANKRLTPEEVQNLYKTASDSYDQAFVGTVSSDQESRLMDQAISGLSTVLKNQPTNNDALNKIVSAFFIKGDLASAEKYLLQYIPSNPENTYMLNLLAYTYWQEGNLPLAEEYYNKSLAIDSANVNTYLDFSRCYIAEGKKNEAIGLLNAGLQKLPNNDGLIEQLNILNK